MTAAINDYYELRLYQCVPGRMADLHHRMGYEVKPLFERHGVSQPLAYWEGFAGPLTPLYVYVLRWANLDERMRAFADFKADPDWLIQRQASCQGAPMVDQTEIMILRPSPAWDAFKSAPDATPIGGVHELRMQDLSARDPLAAQKAWGEVDLKFLQSCGAKVLGVFATWFGARMPHMVTLLAWNDLPQRMAAFQAYEEAPLIRDARAAERAKHGAPLLERCDVHLMRPAAYGMPRANLAA